jgi:hypothetical protein
LNKIKVVLLYLLIFPVIVSCSEDEIIPEEKLVKIYVDILIAQDTTTDKSISADSLKIIVLAKYDVPDSLYIKSIEHYNSSPAKWEEFFNNAIKYVEELRANAEE